MDIKSLDKNSGKVKAMRKKVRKFLKFRASRLPYTAFFTTRSRAVFCVCLIMRA